MGRSRTEVGGRTLLAKTCLSCRLFKQASEFPKYRKIYYHSDCYECNHKKSRKIGKRNNALSTDHAINYRQAWSTNDLRLVQELTNKGLKAEEIAKEVGRTIQSIYLVRNRYDIKAE